MKNLLRLLLGAILLCFFVWEISGQAYQLGLSHPVNNRDSLEVLIADDSSEAERGMQLRRLVALEQSYFWQDLHQMGSRLDRINALAEREGSASASGSVAYLMALLETSQNNSPEAVRLAHEALGHFTAAKDTSGLIHAYAVLVMNNSTIYGNKIPESQRFSNSYLSRIEEIFNLGWEDAHDRLFYQLAYTRYLYGEIQNNAEQLKNVADENLGLIAQSAALSYGHYRFERIRAISLQLVGDLRGSYQANIQLLEQLKPDERWEYGTLLYNIAVDCCNLQLAEEGIAYCEKAIEVLRGIDERFRFSLAGPFTKYRELKQLQGDFAEANRLADSVLKYNMNVFVYANEKQMIQQQSDFELERQELALQLLEASKAKTEERSRWLLVLLLIAMAFVGGVTYFYRQLRKSNAQLHQLRKAREYMFGIIAHDLRRPMHAFHGMAELLGYQIRKKNYAALNKLALALESSGSHIQQMLDNLLNWALVQRGEVPWHPAFIALQPAAESVVAIYRPLSLVKAWSIQTQIAPDLLVWADANALDLLLRNLLDNAIKAIGEEGTITISAQMAGKDQLCLRIEDDGKGMPPEKVSYLNALFATPQDAEMEEASLGMGLLLVARFVHRLGGRVAVESQLGQGSCFTLHLPTTPQG